MSSESNGGWKWVCTVREVRQYGEVGPFLIYFNYSDFHIILKLCKKNKRVK